MGKLPRFATLGFVIWTLALAGACKSSPDKGEDKEAATPAADKDKPTGVAGAPDKKPDPAAQKPAEKKPAKKGHPALTDPEQAKEKAPEKFYVEFETTKGKFTVEVNRSWAPNGADRFYNLVKIGFFTDVKFFRVIKSFMVQFGINGDPEVSAVWSESNIPDDMVRQSNQRSYITFAKTSRPNSRSTQLFINYKDNANLDGQGFAPFGKVIEGMDVVDALEGKYGGTPSNYQPQIQREGNAFLDEKFPGLDSIVKATLVEKDKK